MVRVSAVGDLMEFIIAQALALVASICSLILLRVMIEV